MKTPKLAFYNGGGQTAFSKLGMISMCEVKANFNKFNLNSYNYIAKS